FTEILHIFCGHSDFLQGNRGRANDLFSSFTGGIEDDVADETELARYPVITVKFLNFNVLPVGVDGAGYFELLLLFRKSPANFVNWYRRRFDSGVARAWGLGLASHNA